MKRQNKAQEVNHTGMTLAEVSQLEVIGVCRNNWRQRNVKVYALPDSDEVISVGESFDGSMVIVAREPRSGFASTISRFPSTYIYN